MKKKISAIMVLVCFLLQMNTIAWASTPKSISNQTITSGATQAIYNWSTEKGNVKISVVTVDLTNPYTYLTIIPGAGRWGERSTVSDMTKRTNPIALVNGDFFNMKAEGAPIGATVIGGELASSPSYLTGVYALGITNDRKAYIEQFNFTGKVTKADGTSFPLSGLNKTFYWQEDNNSHSHINKLHLYNDLWGSTKRGSDSYVGTPVEVMLQDNKVVGVKTDGAYEMAVPEGLQILHGDGKAAEFLKTLKVGDEVNVDYAMTPDMNWQMVIGGHALLVNNGQTVAYTKDLSALGGVRARTAAGISADGTKVYIAAVEGRTNESAGLSLTNLASFMQYIGCYKAVNLDGGGSTAMTVRNLGASSATRVINPENNGSERKVVEGLALYSTAPQGILTGLKLSGTQKVFVGESVQYTASGWDEYYNPANLNTVTLEYSDTAGLGAWQGNTFTAQKAGTTEVAAASGVARGTLSVQVLGAESVKNLELSFDKTSVVSGGTAKLTAKATLTDGTTKTVSPSMLTLTAEGGSISTDGVLTATIPSGTVKVTAAFGNVTATKTIKIDSAAKQYALNTLDGVSGHVSPSSITGSVELADDPAGSGSKVLKLNYNFSATKETAASYVVFADKTMTVAANTKKLALDIYGSGHGEWIRVELRDAAGEVHRYTLAQNVDWNGWKTVEFDLNSEEISGEMSLWRIYTVASADENRAATEDRSLYFRNLRLSGSSSALVNVLLHINSSEIVTNGTTQTMDTAPYVTAAGRTMVPIRFITEALGGEVVWDGEEQRVSLILEDSLIQMHIGESTMEVNGVSKSLDVPAEIKNNRTMIPLRAVSEAFGLAVNYEAQDKSITIVN